MDFKKWIKNESSQIDELIEKINQSHPEVKVSAYETTHKIELMQIRVPEGMRNSGVGTEIIRRLQEYAREVGKPIVIRPAADRGRKGDLDRFYKRLGFVHNRGRNKDFTLSSPTASTMYWRPDGGVMENFEIDDLESFYRDNETKVLNHPEVREQLRNTFQADGRLIRRILGVGSEDGRGNYFIRMFNQKHGDREKSLRVPFEKKYPDLFANQERPEAHNIGDDILSWFRGSKITEKDGSPKVVYHGTSEKFDRFEAGEFGFHFGDENAASMMGDTQKFLLRIVNPLRLKDLGVWDPERVLRELSARFKIPEGVMNKTLRDVKRLGKNPDLGQDDDMFANRKAHYEWSNPVRELIKRLGHDGIIYRNEAEGFSDSYIAFDADQIRRI